MASYNVTTQLTKTVEVGSLDQSISAAPTKKEVVGMKSSELRRATETTKRRSSKSWTPREDELLTEAINRNGAKNWRSIALFVGSNRTDVQCLHRWQKVLNPDVTKGHWTTQEDDLLSELVSKHGSKNWKLIAENFPGRMGKQCRERWVNNLDPMVSKDSWSEHEDRLIIEKQRALGNHWALISQDLPGRTDNSVKNHWNSSLKPKILKFFKKPSKQHENAQQDCDNLQILKTFDINKFLEAHHHSQHTTRKKLSHKPKADVRNNKIADDATTSVAEKFQSLTPPSSSPPSTAKKQQQGVIGTQDDTKFDTSKNLSNTATITTAPHSPSCMFNLGLDDLINASNLVAELGVHEPQSNVCHGIDTDDDNKNKKTLRKLFEVTETPFSGRSDDETDQHVEQQEQEQQHDCAIVQDFQPKGKFIVQFPLIDDAWSPGESINMSDGSCTPPSFKLFRITPPTEATGGGTSTSPNAVLMSPEEFMMKYKQRNKQQRPSISCLSCDEEGFSLYSCSMFGINKEKKSPSTSGSSDNENKRTNRLASPFSPELVDWMSQANVSGFIDEHCGEINNEELQLSGKCFAGDDLI